MNYEEKYKNALRWIESIYPTLSSEQRMEAEGILPEIAESEDERIKKEILSFLKFNNAWNKEWIDWLERQGEKSQDKSITKVWKDMRLEVFAQASGNRHEPNYSYNNTKIFSLNDIDEIIEKISEQNLANSAKTCKDDK